MLTPSNVTLADYNNAIALEHETHARLTFLVDNVVFQDEELESGGITLQTYMNPEDSMKFGIAYSTEAIVHLLRNDKTDSINFAHEFTLEFGVEINDTIEWVTVGHFIGKKPIIDITADVVELVAYDKMTRFDTDIKGFINTLVFPTTIQNVYDKLCDYVATTNVVGDEIASVMSKQITSADVFKNIDTCRDLLAKIAEANGCYAKITNDGHVKLIWFEDHKSDQTLSRDYCFGGTIIKLEKTYSKKWGFLEDKKWKDIESIKYGEYDNDNNPFEYSYVRGVWEDEDGTVKEVVQPDYIPYFNNRLWANVENYLWGSVEQMQYKELEASDDLAGNVYSMFNNPFVLYDTDADIKTHLQYILDKLYYFHLYYVAQVSMVGNWLIEPGDTVLLEIRDGEYVEYPIFNRVLNWNGSCVCDYETTGSLT